MPKGRPSGQKRSLANQTMGELFDEAWDTARMWDAMEKRYASSPKALALIKQARRDIDDVVKRDPQPVKSKKLPRKLPDDPVSRAVHIMREATADKLKPPKKPPTR